jgi:polyhydroxybutyrate depolymerase
MLEKIKKFFIGLILAALAISSCTRAVPAGNSSLDKGANTAKKGLFGLSLFKAKTTPTPPGDYVLTINVGKETIEGARTRSYNLHVPSSYDAKTPAGLLILFPPDGKSANDFLSTTQFLAQTDPAGYLVVVPDTYTESKKWTNGISTTSGPDDILFIKTLLADFQQNLKIDGTHIFVSGQGTGGIMALQVASAFGDQVAAVGVVGASAGYRNAKGDKSVTISSPVAPISVMLINGMYDKTIPFGDGTSSKKLPKGYADFDESEGYWHNAIACEGKIKVQMTKKNNVIKHTWSTCKNGTELNTVQLWQGTGAWPLGTEKVKGNLVNISATQYIWDFFTSHPKPATK